MITFDCSWSQFKSRRFLVLTGVLLILSVVLVFRIAQIQKEIQEFQNHMVSGGISPHAIMEKEGKKYLWGGTKEYQHFDISNLLLHTGQFHYGLGREHFYALIEPQFVPAQKANEWLPPEERVLAVVIGDEVKVYPIALLVQHEVVNDVVGGRPIFASYCILADLGAVYERVYYGRTHTFALSGYTYWDECVWDGRDAFVMWDRETESLWWPPIGKAVSGIMAGTPMKVLDQSLWSQTHWKQIRDKYPQAQVLLPGQSMEEPKNWPQYESLPEGIDPSTIAAADSIAPRWGDNAGLGESQKTAPSAGSGTAKPAAGSGSSY